jgi:hypothetical protein
MIEPFRPEGTFIADQKHHCFFEPVHVIPAGARKPFPIFEKLPCIIASARK